MTFTWILIGILSAFAGVLFYIWRQIWIGTIFSAEFGVSDLQGNYTRTYSWMANQLGHMTLGLGTALVTVWIIEFLGAAFDFSAPKEAPGGALPLPGIAPLSYHAVAVLVALAVLFGLFTLSKRAVDFKGVLPVRVLGLAFGLALLAAALLLTLAGLGAPHLDALRGLLNVLFRDFGQTSTTLAQLYTQNTLLAFGGAGFSLAVWTVKEFCSDQVTTVDLLQIARRQRVDAVKSANGNCTGTRCWDEMMKESLWDSRTDWFFYCAGAAIAVGILASHPEAKTRFPEAALEIFFTAFFVGLFVLLGRVFSLRQQAIDRVGAPYAERLAFLRSGVLPVRPPSRPAGATDMLDALHCFAHAQAEARKTHKTNDEASLGGAHLIVTGPGGTGKSPLVIGLANEAALSSLPSSTIVRGVVKPQYRVKARYVQYQRMRLREAEDPSHKKWLRKMEAERVKIDHGVVLVEGRLLYALESSDFAVIDNIPLGEFHPHLSERMKRAIKHMAKGDRRVVWVIDPRPGGNDALESDGAAADETAHGSPGDKEAGAGSEAAQIEAAKLLYCAIGKQMKGATVTIVRTVAAPTDQTADGP
ncbi:MAG: hypothetical protein AAGC92_01550 [Pseudomonadota bacterium]